MKEQMSEWTEQNMKAQRSSENNVTAWVKREWNIGVMGLWMVCDWNMDGIVNGIVNEEVNEAVNQGADEEQIRA